MKHDCPRSIALVTAKARDAMRPANARRTSLDVALQRAGRGRQAEPHPALFAGTPRCSRGDDRTYLVRRSAHVGQMAAGQSLLVGPTAYSDMVRLDGDEAGLLYEAGVATPYETIRYARFNEAYLATPNGTPPGIPGPPAPGPQTADLAPAHNPAYVGRRLPLASSATDSPWTVSTIASRCRSTSRSTRGRAGHSQRPAGGRREPLPRHR